MKLKCSVVTLGCKTSPHITGRTRNGAFPNIAMKTYVKGKQQRLDSENCRLNLNSLPNINRTIKSGRMRLAGNATSMREEKLYAKFWQENLKEREPGRFRC
jgi:hypothetical protein